MNPATLSSQPTGRETPGRSAPRAAHGADHPRLLIVGPLPPPRTGTHVTFQAFCDETQRLIGAARIEIIDTSQKLLKKHTGILQLGNLRQALKIAGTFRQRVRAADEVILFGSNGFLLSMVPILGLLARLAGKPYYVRAFGGSVDEYILRLNPLLRKLLVATFRRAAGVSVQTELLHASLRGVVGPHLHVAPGFRELSDVRPEPAESGPAGGPLRVAFVGLLREDKGVVVLLDALRRLRQAGRPVACDVYGPLWPSDSERIEAALAQTPDAHYGGVLEPSQVVATMARYDVLAFPTYYPGEGHPGVLIEAMMAGIPAITTRFRSIPELVVDGENGLLVPPHDPQALADALSRLASDRRLVAELGHRNWARRTQFDTRRVVPQLLAQFGVELAREAG